MKDSAFFYCPVGSKWQNVLCTVHNSGWALNIISSSLVARLLNFTVSHALIVHPNLMVWPQTLNLWPCVCMMNSSQNLLKSPHGLPTLLTVYHWQCIIDSSLFSHDNLYYRVAQIPVIPKIIFVEKDNTMIWQLCSSLLKNQLLGSFFI